MSPSARSWLALAVFAYLAVPLRAQNIAEDNPPGRFVPRQAETRQELNRLEAVRLYARGQMHERDNQLIEALRVYERAARLDPDGAPVFRALVPLYLALDRTDEALAACRHTLELDPNDYDTWQLLARQFRAQNRGREAADALAKAVAAPA